VEPQSLQPAIPGVNDMPDAYSCLDSQPSSFGIRYRVARQFSRPHHCPFPVIDARRPGIRPNPPTAESRAIDPQTRRVEVDADSSALDRLVGYSKIVKSLTQRFSERSTLSRRAVHTGIVALVASFLVTTQPSLVPRHELDAQAKFGIFMHYQHRILLGLFDRTAALGRSRSFPRSRDDAKAGTGSWKI